jgi:hypothetical protein
MTIELTTEEKVAIINSHIKNIAINKYNIELNLVEENAKSKPDAIIASGYEDQLSQMSGQIAALQSQLNSLTTSN